jgi:hypothetical protein
VANPSKKRGEPPSRAEAEPEPVDLTPDEVITKLIAPTGEAQSAVTLVGYLGPSPKGDTHVRFYFNLDLGTYCDIPRNEILKREKIQRPDDADASKIIVRGDLKLEVVHAVTVGTEASFLQGNIAATHDWGACQVCGCPPWIPLCLSGHPCGQCVLPPPTMHSGHPCGHCCPAPPTRYSGHPCGYCCPAPTIVKSGGLCGHTEGCAPHRAPDVIPPSGALCGHVAKQPPPPKGQGEQSSGGQGPTE